MTRRLPPVLALLALAPLAVACGGDDGDGVDPRANFTWIYTNVLTDEDRCLECHDESKRDDEIVGEYYVQGGELDFATSKQRAYDLLVGQAADGDECEGLGLVLVVPGDPDASLLVSKVEDDEPVCGDAMPPIGEEFVRSSEIAAIRAWIAAGAPND